jgi:hypothetical protein
MTIVYTIWVYMYVCVASDIGPYVDTGVSTSESQVQATYIIMQLS